MLGVVSLVCEDEGEARKAARRLMLLLHPDKCKLRRTREAYDAVVDAKLMAEKIESGPDWQRMCREAEAGREWMKTDYNDEMTRNLDEMKRWLAENKAKDRRRRMAREAREARD